MYYSISTEDINPFVRFACHRVNAMPLEMSYARDVRLFYFLSDGCVFYVDGIPVAVNKYDAVLIRPMVSYYFKENYTGIDYYIMNLDFLFYDSNITTPIPPLDSKDALPLQDISFTDLPEFKSFLRINVPGIELFLIKMSDLYISKKPFYKNEINANCALLLSKTFRTLFNDRENGSLSGIIRYVRDNCSRNINNQDIGKHFHYHPNYINRLFVKHFGLSLHQYVINCRIEAAVLLLSTTDMSIGEIAEKTGWSDSGYFSRVFKEATGYSPEKYKLQ